MSEQLLRSLTNVLLELPFSRRAETEADLIGKGGEGVVCWGGVVVVRRGGAPNVLLQLPFSSRAETEADLIGEREGVLLGGQGG